MGYAAIETAHARPIAIYLRQQEFNEVLLHDYIWLAMEILEPSALSHMNSVCDGDRA